MASQVSSVSSLRLFWGRDLCYVSGSLSMGSRFTVEQLILCLLRLGFTVLSCLLLYPFLFSPSSVQESPLPPPPLHICSLLMPWPLGLVPSRVWQMGNCVWTGQECKLSPNRHLQAHFRVNSAHNSDLSICFVAEGMAGMTGMTWSRGHV